MSVADDKTFGSAGSFARFMGQLPAAFAVLHGERHTLVYANAAFRALMAPAGEPLVGQPIDQALEERGGATLVPLLDRARRTGEVARNRRIEPVGDNALLLSCTVWPDVNRAGETEHVVIELRVATPAEITVGLQREMSERLILSALREQDSAAAAEESRQRAALLAAESRRLVESLDEDATQTAITRLALPHLGAWCIVDTLDEDNAMHRLAIVHPDPDKQALLEELDGRWIPAPGDEYGLPALLRNPGPSVLTDGANARSAADGQDPEVADALKDLGLGGLLTVPLIIRDRLVGAITFVGAQDRAFTDSDVGLAEDLASRAALALDRARLYGEALALRVRAESASAAKSTFLRMMSHELRTPLNAIGGYVDLIDMELRGPVTAAQHADLERIRVNQRYLTGLVSDLLNVTKIGSGSMAYSKADVNVKEVVAASVALVEPLVAHAQLTLDEPACTADMAAHGDREKIIQIIVNLLSNSLKFTPPGGRLSITCESTETGVLIHVADTGIGIPADQLEEIFEPFVQVESPRHEPAAGVGLGLAISRGLARDMAGDLTVVSTLGEGSRFTLTLAPPRGSQPPEDAGRVGASA